MSDEKKVFKDLTKFTVKRSDWLRGKGSDESGLLLDGKMCCLGFYAKAQGFSDEELKEATSPGDLVCNTLCDPKSRLIDYRSQYGTMRHCDSVEGVVLMTTNDDQYILDEVREKSLKEDFLKLGVEVEFVD